MEQRRRQTSVEQLTLLVEFMEHHKDLALGRVRSKEARALSTRLWRECTLILNSEGPSRTDKEWAKVWNDLKCRVRAKLVSNNASLQGTGGGPSTTVTLTHLEEKIGNILGLDVGPLPNVRQEPFATPNELNENIAAEVIVPYNIINPNDQPEQLDAELQIDPGVLSGAHVSVNVSPTPSLTGQAPSTGMSRSRSRVRRQRQRGQRTSAATTSAASLSPPPPAQSNRSALEESRLMVLRIEEMRAKAALVIAEGFKLLAESIDHYLRQTASRSRPTE